MHVVNPDSLAPTSSVVSVVLLSLYGPDEGRPLLDTRRTCLPGKITIRLFLTRHSERRSMFPGGHLSITTTEESNLNDEFEVTL